MDTLKVHFRSNEDFVSQYQDNLEHGGLFCPTTTPQEPGTRLMLELRIPALPNKVLIRGRVKEWHPALPRLRVRAGAIVAFDKADASKRDFILDAINGDAGEVHRRKHTRVPVHVPVRYRIANAVEYTKTVLTEISVGGAMMVTPEKIPLDTDVILEIKPPGAVQPLPISGVAAYHTDTGTGLKFVYRDAAGSRRLRELVRRLRTA